MTNFIHASSDRPRRSGYILSRRLDRRQPRQSRKLGRLLQCGVAAVEFALILPLLLALLFGMAEVSLLLYDQAVITNASREGARAGIVLKTPKLTTTEIEQVALN